MKTITLLTITLVGILSISCNSFDKPKSTKDLISELQKLDDSLGERNRLLLRGYAYDALNDKMTRDQAWERSQEMKKIGERRIEIQHQIDSLKLLPKTHK